MVIQDYIAVTAGIFGAYILPLLFAVAFAVFLWNVFRYFIIESNSPLGREKARRQGIWGLLALVILTGVWGIVSIFLDELRISRVTPVCPDYMPNCISPNNTYYDDFGDGGRGNTRGDAGAATQGSGSTGGGSTGGSWFGGGDFQQADGELYNTQEGF